MRIKCPSCDSKHTEETLACNDGNCPICGCVVIYDCHYDTQAIDNPTYAEVHDAQTIPAFIQPIQLMLF